MDRRVGEETLMRHESHAWSVDEPPSEHESIEVEPQTELRRPNLELSRTISGPPYTIFSSKAKVFIVTFVSISSLISPFGATTFYPALNVLAKDLHVTPSLINIALTTYMIAQAIAPAIIAGASDTSGRRLSFIICFIIFIVANIGLALQTNYAALLVLRVVQASGCSAAIALTNAVVADVATSAERGKYMGYATAGLLMGPSFGPTIGGILAQFLGWRSIFYFNAIFTTVLLFVFTFFFPETCRNVVGNGSIPAKGVNQSILGYLQHRRHMKETESIHDSQSFVLQKKHKFNFPNPLAVLKIIGEKESGILLFYNGLFFTGLMVVTASVPYLYHQTYNLDELDVGLCYISMGMGSMTSTLTMGHVVDWNFRRHAKRLGMVISKRKQQDLANFPIERVRFEVVIPGHIIGIIGVVIFGWTIKFQTHLAGPEVAFFLVGFGISTAFNLTNTLLIDLHRDKPATATAAVNFCRCLMSAAGAAAIIPMCKAMNPGWAFTLFGFVYTAVLGVAFLLMAKGQKWRAEAAEKLKQKEAAKAAADETDIEAQSNADHQSIQEKDLETKTSNET